MFPTVDKLNQCDVLSEISTMLCIGDEYYCRSYPYKVHVAKMINFYKESEAVVVDGIMNSDSLNYKILVLRCINLILKNVPHSSITLCSSKGTNLTHHLLEFYSDIEKIKNFLDSSGYNPATELFEEWITCLETVAMLQAETIDVSSIAWLIEQFSGIQYFSKFHKKLLIILSNVIQKLPQNTQFSYISSIIEKLLQLLRDELNQVSSSVQRDSKLLSQICDCIAILIFKFRYNSEILSKLTLGDGPDSKIKPLASQLISLISQLNDSSSLSKILKLLYLLCKYSKDCACQMLNPSNLNILLSCIGGLKDFQSIHIDQSQLMNALNSNSEESSHYVDLLLLLRTLFPPLNSSEVFTTEIIPEHQWFWEDDFHNMNPFDKLSSKELEKALNQGKQKITILRRYEIVFSEMKQYNIDTRLQRCINRSPLPSSYERLKNINIKIESTRKSKKNSENKKSEENTIDPRIQYIKDHSFIIPNLIENITSFLSEILELDSSPETFQDASIILSSLFTSIPSEKIEISSKMNDIIRLIIKMINHAISADGSNDDVVISHCLTTLKVLVLCSNISFFKASLMKNGADKIFENLIESMKSTTLIKSLQNFYETHLTNFTPLKTSEELSLEDFCFQLSQNDIFNKDLFINAFSKPSEVSDHLFANSGFVNLFSKLLFSEDSIFKIQFKEIISSHPEIISNLLSILTSYINSNFVVSDNTEGSNLDIIQDDLYNLENSIPVTLTNSNDLILPETFRNSIQVHPFLTIKELKKEILGTESDDFNLTFKEKELQLFDTILELSNEDSDKFYNIWDNGCSLNIYRKGLSISNDNDIIFKESFVRSTKLDESNLFSDEVKNAFQILRYIHHLNSEMDINSIDQSFYYNLILSSKLGGLFRTGISLLQASLKIVPQWAEILMKDFHFIFPLPTRLMYFFVTHFGAAQALVTSYTVNSADVQHLGQVRSKIIDRQNILPEAKSILKNYSGTRTILEFEYENEAGIGLGPTLEFYSQVAGSLQLMTLGMWITVDDTNSPFVHSPNGLFPTILPKDENEKNRILDNFTFLGRLIGKCIEDNRLIDLPLSHAFLKLILGHPLTLKDLIAIESQSFYNSIISLIEYNNQIKEINNNNLNSEEKERKFSSLSEIISSFYLTFRFRNYDLIEDGDNVEVSIHNLDLYLEKLIKYLLVDMANEQVSATINGLSEIVNIDALNIFTPKEFLKIFSGERKMWSNKEEIESNIQLSGYSLESEQIQWLIDFLFDLNEVEQKQFLEFSTGCTTLPVGGFSALKPKLQIVKSITKELGSPDKALPTCNTCFHYFKLPEYSSKEILNKRCKVALEHGRKSFDLT